MQRKTQTTLTSLRIRRLHSNAGTKFMAVFRGQTRAITYGCRLWTTANDIDEPESIEGSDWSL